MAISDRINEMYTHVGDVYDTITNVDVNNGNNLLKYPYVNTTSTVSGVTFTDNGNGSITINGTSTSSTYSLWFLYENAWNYAGLSFELEPGTYTFKALGTDKVSMPINIYFSDNTHEFFAIYNDDVTKTITEKVRLNMRLLVNGGVSVNNVTIYPQINKGNTALPYQPYTDNPTYKNIENIPSTIRKSYLDIMNNGIDTIWNNWEKVEGTGETLTLNSTEEAPMKINLKGNTSQETTTGQNLLPNNKTTETRNGVTFTVNSDKSVTITGTATVNTDYYFVGNWTNYVDFGLTTGTYNLNGCTGGSEQTYMLFTVMNRNGNIYYYSSTTGGRQMVVETGDTFRIFIRVISGTTVNKTIYPQINVGSTPLSYEPYTGGQPSPSPDYPQAIHVVSGDNSIEVCGKNLYVNDKDTHTFQQSSATWRFIDGTGGANGSNLDTKTIYKARVYNGITYTFSSNITASSSIVSQIVYENEGFIKRIDGSTITFNETFTASRDGYVILRLYVGANVSVSVSNVTLEKGSTATTYEPYQDQSYPINLGDIELCKIGDYQDSIKKSTGKNLIQSGYRQGNTTSTTATNRLFTSHSAYVKANQTYTISTNLNTSNFYWAIRVASSDFPTNADITTGDWNTTSSLTYTPTQNGYLAVIIGKRDLNANISESDIGNTYFQVEEGSTATSYEPYGKVWYLNKQIGKVVLDGSENWGNFNIEPSGLGRAMVSSSNVYYNSTQNTIMANNMVGVQYSGSWNNTYDCIASYSNNKFIAYLKNASDLATFKSILNNSNAIVYYVLATPITIEITDSTLISQLEAVKKSYTTQTNISQENNDKPFILDVTALKQLT